MTISISLGGWRDLTIAPDEDGVDQLYLVHTEPGGTKELFRVHIGENKEAVYDNLIYAAQRLKIHAQ